MVKTMITFTYLATILSIASTAIVCMSYLSTGRKKEVMDFTLINDQIKICRKASFIFTFLTWLLISCKPETDCLKGYAVLAKSCSKVGFVWVVFAFVCIAFSILMLVLKRKSESIGSLSRFRNTAFFMGAVFFILSFLLNMG